MSYISIGKIDKSAVFEADFEPRFKLLTEKELIGLPGPRWLIKHIIPNNSLILMYGAPGAGKRHIALALTQSIANVMRYLDAKPTKPRLSMLPLKVQPEPATASKPIGCIGVFPRIQKRMLFI
tara:strand:+ start:236 stop:604 length:369 start_codon:yes stop_codon:yes gene_type:complete